MIYADISDDIKRATNLLPVDVNMRYTTDAIEILSNKGDFEILLGYLDIVTTSNLVALPPQVDSVLKVNIDGNPSFSRDRLYEFTMNGPGSNTERVDFTWEERGTVPTMAEIPVNGFAPSAKIYAKAGDGSDNDKTMTVVGQLVTGEEREITLTMHDFFNNLSTEQFVKIVRVNKPVTNYPASLYAKWILGAPGAGDALLSTYQPNETEPAYRRIRLSKIGGIAHILFRRRTYKITSLTDFIPVKSKRAIELMVKALRKYDQNDPAAEKDEATAVKWAQEEQKSTTSFIELAGATEVAGIRGLNINNRDSLIMADVFDDADRIFGKIGTDNLFDKTTETIELLANKGQWDPLVGEVTINTDQFYYLTLPRYVETILALNICNHPAHMQNGWFEFHLNGPGGRRLPCNTWTMLTGDFPTFRDVNWTQQLVAIPDLASDAGIEVRAFGYYQGKRITTDDGTGKMADGFPVTVNMGGVPDTSAQSVDRIERITKGVSNGFIKLLGFDSSRNLQNTIGYYWPDETEPRYRRIKLPRKAISVTIKYRKRTRKIGALTDPLHIASKTALTAAMAAIKLMDEGKFQEAAAAEGVALRLMEEEQSSNNPLTFPDLEVETDANMSNFALS